MPVVLVFTKFDRLVSQVLFDTPGSDSQHHERAKDRAQGMCEESYRRLLLKNVPAEIVSSTCSTVSVAWKGCLTPLVIAGNSEFSNLIDKLIVTTRRLLPEPRVAVAPSETQNAKLRLPSPVPLAWSVAQRASRNVIIEASIEYVTSPLFLKSLLIHCYRVGRSRESDTPTLRVLSTFQRVRSSTKVIGATLGLVSTS